jgi:hypothetical protein
MINRNNRAQNSALRRQRINPTVYPQISQICTDLRNYKEIIEFLFLRNLHNLWIINLDFAAGLGMPPVSKFGEKYLSCAPLKVKKRKEALILHG